MARPKRASAGHEAAELRIRMYRVGFGDFFLVTIPSKHGPQHIVIDCGVTRGKTGKGDIATIKTAVRHMAEETKSTLALIIVTHRHQDHIIGFSRCATEFAKFQVDAIWLPYWETEYAPKVANFQAELENLAMALGAAAMAGAPGTGTAEILGIVENATGISPAEGPGGGTNAKSLDLLKNKLGVKPSYYAKGDKAQLPPSLVEAGLAATILGPPPASDADFLTIMDLKKGTGQFLDAANGGRKGTRFMPFDPEFVVDATRYPPAAFREWAPRKRGKIPDFSKRYPEALERAVRSATPDAMFMAAKKLDAMLNNQSLVILFEWNGKKLLFAGDAQGGNWENWLFDSDKPTKDPAGMELSGRGKSILASIDFYKVGHHGSTNATPIPAVDGMGEGFVSMCSVEADTFGSEENKSEVPRIPLLEALAKKSTLVRSDQIHVDVADVDVPASVKGKPAEPKKGRIVVGSCYVDYFL